MGSTMAPGSHMGYFAIHPQPYGIHDPMAMRYGLPPGIYDPRMQLSGGRHKKVRGRATPALVCFLVWWPGMRKQEKVSWEARRIASRVMCPAFPLDVADGGMRLLIGDQASDQDWLLNLPKTTDKGASKSSPLLSLD